jgi:threonine dehydratase
MTACGGAQTVGYLKRSNAQHNNMLNRLPHHRLSPSRIAVAARSIDPVFLHTPQFRCEPLNDLLGCDVTLKVETLNPIRSFKGRGADHFVGRLAANGDVPQLVCASAGNFGQAMAYVCRKHGLPLVVYAARTANALKVERMRALGAEVRLEGDDFDAAKLAARAWADANGALLVEDGREPDISEGAGTIAVELFANGATYDAVLIPLGNGALLNGMARWIRDASPATTIIGVVAEGAPAMLESYRAGANVALINHEHTDTIADGIAVRRPIPEAVADMQGLVDEVVKVNDAQILQAMRTLHIHAGLVVEPAGAAGLAAITSRFAGKHVATVLCGGNLTPTQMQAWLN